MSQTIEYAYDIGTNQIVYRIPGQTHGDGQIDTDNNPVWLTSDTTPDDVDLDDYEKVNTL